MSKMLNVELLRKIADKIEAEPTCYNQQNYVCGTAHCIGGWAATLGGAGEPNFENGQNALQLATPDAHALFAASWMPCEGLTVPQALRAIADGSTIEEVSYNRDGYDRDGYDRAGYNRDGYDRAGYDRDGYDRAGYDRAGYNRDGYDRDGYDRDGYDRDGYDRAGYGFDGRDKDGVDRYGRKKTTI
jgi:hypothetical protein